MTSFATPSVAVHEKLPDSSTPSGSCQSSPLRSAARACPSSLPGHPCDPIRYPAPPCACLASPPIRALLLCPAARACPSRPLPRPCDPIRYPAAPCACLASPPIRALLLRSATRACPSRSLPRPCDPTPSPAPPCACLAALSRHPCVPIPPPHCPYTLLTFCVFVPLNWLPPVVPRSWLNFHLVSSRGHGGIAPTIASHPFYPRSASHPLS